jgi:7-cyano-7-deazaguanine reductase
MVESKSLKLYLLSFRNHGDFHEDCMNKIMKDLIKLRDPRYIKYGENSLQEVESK